MKILVLSFYYQPDLCAGSFRCTALVKQLLSKDENCTIDVISTLPNRYSSFSVDAQKFEQNGRLKVYRIELPTHKSGMLDQAKSFTHYYLQAIKLTKNNDYDLVVATSSRLFTAFLGKRIASKKNLPLYLDIRDIFIDTLENILPRKLSFVLSPILKVIERYTFKNAATVNLVSEGFLPYFKNRYPNLTYDSFTNGIDNDFINEFSQVQKSKNIEVKSPKTVTTIVYAGNLGEGQGLHKIIPELAARLGDKYLIQVIGDGGRKNNLVDAVEKSSVNNVQFLPPVGRIELIEYYNNADILFLHLNDYDAFKKVLPSKIFEYASFNKPILAGVSGYAAQFINQFVINAAVFNPCNAEHAIKAIDNLVFEGEYRTGFIKKYSRTNIMSEMAGSIISLANRES